MSGQVQIELEKEYKIYAGGIGLVKDDELLLVKYGFVK